MTRFVSIFIVLSIHSSTLWAQISPQFEPISDVFMTSKPNAVEAINIVYDSIQASKQLFHLFLPEEAGQFPLVIYIHGGGFTGGNPGSVFTGEKLGEDVAYFLDNNVAVASVGYRLINETTADSVGVIKCLSDSKRALQFIRYYAEDLHIDPDKIALMGTSAGAGTSLWLGVRDDMAAPESQNPILRMSTRVSAVFAQGSQSTYDLYKWETEVFDNYDGQGNHYTLDSIAAIMTTERVNNFYGGIDSLYQILYDSSLIQYRADVDMLGHMTSDDPPIYVYSQSRAAHPSEDVLHHSNHGKEIYETALLAGVGGVKAEIPTQGIADTGGESPTEFLVRHLGGGSQSILLSEPAGATVAVYPNPAADILKIRSSSPIQQIEWVSLMGQTVGRLAPYATQVEVDISQMSAGTYLLVLTDREGVQTKRRVLIK